MHEHCYSDECFCTGRKDGEVRRFTAFGYVQWKKKYSGFLNIKYVSKMNDNE